jgi:hypothetical protein
MSDNLSYWRRQGDECLFPEVDLFAPEQKRFAGKILIIGGNKGLFFAVANALSEAKRFGAGEVRVLLPDVLKNSVPSTPELYFAEAEFSGAFGKAALPEMLRLADWADAVILIGDSGKNAETSLAFMDFMKECNKPIFVTRDAVDAICPGVMDWSMRETETGLFLTMLQLQKTLRTLYYPKVVTLSMPTNQLVETLHKFTLSYPMSIATFHNGLLLMAQNGEVVTQSITDTEWTSITLWSGALLVRSVVAWCWNSEKQFDRVFAAIVGQKNRAAV